MNETVTVVEYFYVEVPDQPGQAVRMLDQLSQANVNLLAFSGFPRGRRAQVDFVPADPAQFRTVAKTAKWKVVGPKKAFLVQGVDRVGAITGIFGKLAGTKINVTASDAVCAGEGRFGMILWVKARDVARAAKLLGASASA